MASRKTFLLAVLLLGPSTALAQAGQVRIELDKHIASVGEEVQVTVSIELEGTTGYSRFVPPNFSGFRVAGGGMTSQNIEMTNWQVHRTESHTYTVAPLREGVLTVGPAAIEVGGRTIRSATVSLRVTKGVPGARPPASADPDDPAPETVPPPPTPERVSSSVFISASANPLKVYVGQQVLCVWSLFTAYQPLDFQPRKQPTTDEFWSEDLHSPQRLEFERRMVQERMFLVAVLARKALFPQRVGKLRIGSMEAQIRTMENFGSSVLLRSDDVSIEVLPLPKAGRPAEFSDTNVGQYQIFASLDRDTVHAGDAVTLKLVVRGVGNLSQLKVPKLTALDGFKVYEPKSSDKLVADEQVQGEKIIDVLLMPTRSGKLTIPSIRLDYFDPQKASYQQAKTAPLTVTVTGELPVAAARAGGSANVLGPSIRPPRPAGRLDQHAGGNVSRQLLFWVLFVLPAGVLLLLSAGERVRARLARETAGSLRRAAVRQVRVRLRRAQEARRRGDASAFFGEISGVLRTQIDHKLEVRCEGLTRAELRETMRVRGVDELLAEALLRELDNCDFARFAPSASGDQQMAEAAQRARELVERTWRLRVQQEGSR